MQEYLYGNLCTMKRKVFLAVMACLFFIAPASTTLAEGEDPSCRATTVVSVSVMHTWPKVCESLGKCWRKITMYTNGQVELADNDGFIQDTMDQPSVEALSDILKRSTLLTKLDNPLAPDCPGHDGIDDTEIRVDLSNGASLSTKWAGGCRNIEGHPFKLVNDLAIQQRVDHVACDIFTSLLFEEGFDRYSYEDVNDVRELLDNASTHGLCFPCGGLC